MFILGVAVGGVVGIYLGRKSPVLQAWIVTKVDELVAKFKKEKEKIQVTTPASVTATTETKAE
jgi:hypothetical protein